MRPLNHDEFEVGSYIVGMGGKKWTRYIDSGFFLGGTTQAVECEDNSFKGDTFIVVEIDLPFVVVRMVVSKCGLKVKAASADDIFSDGRPMIVDLNDGFKWGRPSPEFLKAMLGNDYQIQEPIV